MTKRFEPIAVINVVPFVDVMLVLMIVFLMMVPSLHRHLGITLLRAANHGHVITGKSMSIVLDAHKHLWMNHHRYIHNQGIRHLERYLKRSKTKQLLIYADQRTDFQRVMDILGLASALKIKTKLGYSQRRRQS